jgi:hypothetical protein
MVLFSDLVNIQTFDGVTFGGYIVRITNIDFLALILGAEFLL